MIAGSGADTGRWLKAKPVHLPRVDVTMNAWE